VLIENVSFDSKFYIGRSYMDVPDMDGVVFITNENRSKDKIGKFVKCKVTDVQDYDLIGKMI
jgi:ribosomal protein S12 methylthiotransferase